MAKVYEAVVGIEWEAPEGARRLEPGEQASDLPEASIPWLLEQGLIREARRPRARAKAETGGDA